MALSAARFLTTHTGSLPRPDDLIRTMFAKEEGVPVDRTALDARIGEVVSEIVKKQAASGIDIVNDGEMSKPSYATYVKDRLSGFAGTSNTLVFRTSPSSRGWRNASLAIPGARGARHRPAPARSRSPTPQRRRPMSRI